MFWLQYVSNPGRLGPTVPGQITPGKRICQIMKENELKVFLCITQIFVGADVFTGGIDK